MHTDTIIALSSGALPSGVAIVRASGPGARALMSALSGGVPPPRRASLRRFRDAAGETLDRGLALFFPAPNTATGEDLAEFHLHGGRAVVAAFLDAATAHPEVRLAEAGEFTRRAFENGRLDLTGAEGLADLVAAETDGQRRLALAVADGGLRRLYDGWASRLTAARARLEASFDFADEGDVGEDAGAGVMEEVAGLVEALRGHLADAHRGEILREGYKVAIVGPPNAGKSSLLNALADRDVAIVTDIPGTTRDVVEVKLDLGGIPVRLSDTAGIRETADKVEAIGVERARAVIEEAQLVLALADPAEASGWKAVIADLLSHVKHPLAREHVPTEDEARPNDGAARPGGHEVLLVRTKIDRVGGDGLLKKFLGGADEPVIAFDHAISIKSGEGLADLVATIAARAKAAAGDPDAAVPVRQRQRQLLGDALRLLNAALADPAAPPEVQAERLRRAQDRLGAITGRIGVEDLLDVIFAEFCIGK